MRVVVVRKSSDVWGSLIIFILDGKLAVALFLKWF